MSKLKRDAAPAFLMAVMLVGGEAPSSGAKAADRKPEPYKTVVSPPTRGSEIPAAEISTSQVLALEGSASAAQRLANYYQVTVYDRKKELYWRSIADENGAPEERYGMAVALSVQADLQSRIRARYLFHRIVREGPQELVDLARDCLEQMATTDKNYSEHLSADNQ